MTTANPLLTGVAAMAALEGANDIHVDDSPLLVELDLGSLARVAGVLRVAHNPSLDASALPRPPGATVVIGGNRGDVFGLDPCPGSGNCHCEAPPADDLCAPTSDSDCFGDILP